MVAAGKGLFYLPDNITADHFATALDRRRLELRGLSSKVGLRRVDGERMRAGGRADERGYTAISLSVRNRNRNLQTLTPNPNPNPNPRSLT